MRNHLQSPPFVNFQSHVTPLNMQSCFVNDEFVVWVDNSGKAPSPPLARGAKGVAKGSPGAPGPIDPSTGKPLFSLVGNLVSEKKRTNSKCWPEKICSSICSFRLYSMGSASRENISFKKLVCSLPT